MGCVFVSYRHDDSEGQARALVLELANRLGKSSVFIDVDDIPLGRDFRRVLNERLDACDQVLVLIGPSWTEAGVAPRARRLDDPNDYVRLEIAAALKRSIPVTPLLLHGAEMPRADQLPDDIREFAYRHAFDLRHSKQPGH